MDVTVRDGKGQPIRNLTANDFEILENGKPQTIVTFAQEEVAQPTQTIATAATLTKIGEAKSGVPVRVAATAATDPKTAARRCAARRLLRRPQRRPPELTPAAVR